MIPPPRSAAGSPALRLSALLAITVLCGSATAVVGPIAFIGLMMPHMSRWLVGADHRWSLPVTLLATPALLLFADVLGRLLSPVNCEYRWSAPLSARRC
ncbi:Ferric enterobactin transport system permease protein fepD [Raoultella planticola]|uniref:Ferric enterobactin transport system permease protein fepD n=1 Tax=Raoultella planticola TaxID=575 RepID=A0A485CPT2_RAOPL|nr:Ferric enterobactin transport system permease protein fepD [Raoultella planticola]